MVAPPSSAMMRTPARFSAADARANSAGSGPASILGDSLGVAPTKPTKPGFDGFVGATPGEYEKIRAFGFQSNHRLPFAGLGAVALIPIPPDSLRTDWTGARRRVSIRRTAPGPIRHLGE